MVLGMLSTMELPGETALAVKLAELLRKSVLWRVQAALADSSSFQHRHGSLLVSLGIP